MKAEHLPRVADVLREYVGKDELSSLCEALAVPLEFDHQDNPDYTDLSKRLVLELEHANHRRLLAALLDTASRRAQDIAAHSSWEPRYYHERMQAEIRTIEQELEQSGLPPELDVEEGKPFTAKSEVRELLAAAETQVTVVDNYVGASTLDCFREVGTPIRLLTGAGTSSITPDFDRALCEFVAEGRAIQVRRHARLHDRYVLFNERCWMVGSSLKDAGKKRLNLIEVVDARANIEAEVERKWAEAAPHP